MVKSYKFNICIGYHDLYKDERESIEDLLKPISRANFFAIYQQFRNEFLDRYVGEVLVGIDAEHKWPFAEDLLMRLKKYKQECLSLYPGIKSNRYILASEISLIELLKQEMAITPPIECKLSSHECYKRIIFAILKCNDLIFELQIKNDVNDREQMLKLLLTNNFSIYSITGYNEKELGLVEMLKAFELKSLCEENQLFSGWVKSFLGEANIIDIKHYILKFLLIYSAFTDKKRKEIDVTDTIKYNQIELKGDFRPFKYWRINDVVGLERNNDYLAFRDVPFIEIAKDSYIQISIPFVLQKIYSSVVFELLKASKLKAQQFFGIFDKDFSEKRVFNKYIQKSFFYHRKTLILNGEQLEKGVQGQKGYHPLDFYVRQANSIFLFEHKDIRIPAKERSSRNYEIIKKSIQKKLVESAEHNLLGVSQIADNINRINDGSFPWDRIDNPKKIRIYPILVIFDSQFNLHGINFLLNHEMRDRLKQGTTNVHDLTVIDDATLMKYCRKYATGSIPFINSIIEYHNYIRGNSKAVDDAFNRFLSYPDFMNQNYKRMNLINEMRSIVRAFEKLR